MHAQCILMKERQSRRGDKERKKRGRETDEKKLEIEREEERNTECVGV